MMIEQLRQKLYTGELLFLLRPAHPGYSEEDAEISVSREAATALNDQPLYEFTLSSSVFIVSPDNELTTPLGHSMQLDDLYTSVTTSGMALQAEGRPPPQRIEDAITVDLVA